MTDRPAPVRTLIVDDEPLARRRLRTLLAEEPDVEIVGEAGNGNAAVRAIAQHRPDLVLLDIQMPGKDGFDVLAEIEGDYNPVVVFITAHDEHAIRAFEVQALDYVLKPVLEGRLRAAVRRAIARLQEQRRGDLSASMASLLRQVRPNSMARIPVKHDGRVTFVPAADIHWIEADGDLAKIHTARAAHLVRMTMAELEERLKGRRFLRIHRSALVNADSILEVQPLFKGGYEVVLKDGTRLRSGRAYRDAIRGLLG